MKVTLVNHGKKGIEMLLISENGEIVNSAFLKRENDSEKTDALLDVECIFETVNGQTVKIECLDEMKIASEGEIIQIVKRDNEKN